MGKPNRRTKNEKTTTTKATTTTTAAATATSNSTSATGDEQQMIARAQAAVEKSRYSAQTLHTQWRLHLLRLSYMVVLITMHQLQSPVTYCLYDIKSYNKSLTPLDDIDKMKISGWAAWYYVVNDTLTEFLAVMMGICLTIFLTQMHNASAVTLVVANANSTQQQQQQQQSSFVTNLAYMISTGLVPPVLNFYVTRKNSSGGGGGDSSSSSSTMSSCLDHSSVTNKADHMWTRYSEQPGNNLSAVRGFPVVIIFHIIATGCCWFIEMQSAQQDRNVRMLENLKRDLANSKKNS